MFSVAYLLRKCKPQSPSVPEKGAALWNSAAPLLRHPAERAAAARLQKKLQQKNYQQVRRVVKIKKRLESRMCVPMGRKMNGSANREKISKPAA